MSDILFKTEDRVFGYRVAGICIRNGKVLLQTLKGGAPYAFPGGHVDFGESSQETLTREFREEADFSITVGDLKWVAEIFFPWENRSWQQICLYYLVEITGEIPQEETIPVHDHLGGWDFDLIYRWVPLEEVKDLPVHPQKAKELLFSLQGGVQHFVSREQETKGL